MVPGPICYYSDPSVHHRQLRDSPWEFFRPVTGMGSNSSSVPTSALACWGSKSEIRRVESAADVKKNKKIKNSNTTNAADMKNCTVSLSDDGFSLLKKTLLQYNGLF